MRLAAALTLAALVTVEQRDVNRSTADTTSCAVSDDGRFVAFTTYVRIAAADTDAAADIYVLDRIRNEVTLESVGARTLDGLDAAFPDISADGRLLVYEVQGRVVFRDRQSRRTTVIGPGRQPSIAASGGVVVFSAQGAGPAGAHDPDVPREQVYAWTAPDGQVARVSLDLHGLDETTAASVAPSISADGRYVAFTGRPPFAGPARVSGRVYVRDLQTQTTTLVGEGWAPALSGDGGFVAFVTPVGGQAQVALADLGTGTRRIISRRPGGGLANGPSTHPALSHDGRFVVFQSEASDLLRGDDFNLLPDVFLFDRTSGAITRISGEADVWMAPSGGPAIDGHGTVVAFSSRHPTSAADDGNDFDLYVASLAESPALK